MPAHHPYVTAVLLGLAVALTLLCCLGLLVMRDAFQRIHFSAPVVSFGTLLIAIAVWIEESDPQARVKVMLIGGLLFMMNSILTHATGKAFRIKQSKHWDVLPREGIPLVGKDTPPGGPEGE